MFKTNIFSVTVAIEEGDGFYWTSLPEHQNIQFTEVLAVCSKHKYFRVYIFIESDDVWQEIAVVE